jgi:hypothetical protein
MLKQLVLSLALSVVALQPAHAADSGDGGHPIRRGFYYAYRVVKFPVKAFCLAGAVVSGVGFAASAGTAVLTDAIDLNLDYWSRPDRKLILVPVESPAESKLSPELQKQVDDILQGLEGGSKI